jgi:NAD(P)-dependent dehydrogenase (short-subunit alcohol dehydrogenase family)
MQLDVTDPSSVERLSRELGARPVDLLINNAGILPMMPTLDEIDMDDYQRVMERGESHRITCSDRDLILQAVPDSVQFNRRFTLYSGIELN